MIGFILDIIIVAIIILFIFLGYKRGLVKLIISLIAFVVAIVITLALYKPVSKAIIDNTELDESISSAIYTNIGVKNIEEEHEFIKYINQYTKENIGNSDITFLGNSINEISQKIIELCSMIGIYLIARVVLLLLSMFSDVITNLPIIKQFNEMGGIIYGVLQGTIIVYTLLAVTFIIVSTSVNTEIINAINSSYICNFMYYNNIILKVIL